MTTIALRQAMVPTAFFVGGLSLLTISYLPMIQQYRLAPYPPSALPYATSPASTPVTSAPVATAPPGADSHPTLKLAPPGSGKVKVADPIPRGNDIMSAPKPRGKEIPPSTNREILKANKPITIGRADPFKSLIVIHKPVEPLLPPPPDSLNVMAPPPPPGTFASALPSVAPPSAPPIRPSVAPQPAPQLKAGISLQGMVGGDPSDTAAIVTIDGNTQLVRVGDVIRRPNFILRVVGINEQTLSIILSDGKGHVAELKTE